MKDKTKMLSFTALFAVLNFIAFTYGKINIPISVGGTTAIHVANAVVVLSAWLLGPVYGGLAGAVGLSMADIMDPLYISSAPKTFILKFCIGYISGKAAEKLGLRNKTEKKDISKAAVLSAAAGLGFNVIFDPIIGYLFKRFVLGMPASAASILLTWTAGVTAFNAIVCVFISTALYLALHKHFFRIIRR